MASLAAAAAAATTPPSAMESARPTATEEQEVEEMAESTDGSVSAKSSKSSKNARKKANRAAAKRAANAASAAVLAACNALSDATVLGDWFRGFRSYRGGQYRFHYARSDELSDAALEWAFRLTRLNMQRMYERTEGWGWSDKAKMAECRHPDARYLIVTQLPASTATAASADATVAASASPADPVPAADAAAASADAAAAAADDDAADGSLVGEPVGFCSFRFVLGDDDRQPVLYVYELQLESDQQRQGLGRRLMALTELLAWRSELSRVVLTVFKRNQPAIALYTKKLGFQLDATDPSLHDEEAPYQILAKRAPAKAAPAPSGTLPA